MGDDRYSGLRRPLVPRLHPHQAFPGQQRFPYNYVDVDKNPEVCALRAREDERTGQQIIPTMSSSPDGSFLVEPY